MSINSLLELDEAEDEKYVVSPPYAWLMPRSTGMLLEGPGRIVRGGSSYTISEGARRGSLSRSFRLPPTELSGLRRRLEEL